MPPNQKVTVPLYCFKYTKNIQHTEVLTLGDVITPKKNHRKFIIMGQIIGPGKIDIFCFIESIIKLIHFPKKSTKTMNYRKIIVLNRQGRLKH